MSKWVQLPSTPPFMREYRNGNEVGTSQLRWIGSSPPSLTNQQGAGRCSGPGRARAEIVKKLTQKFLQKVLTFPSRCGIIYIESEDTIMLQKNIEKEERKNRKTWQGYYTRKTPTKKEKEEKNRKKYRKGIDKDD